MLVVLLAILGLLIAAAGVWTRATQPRNPTKQEIRQAKKADVVNAKKIGDELKNSSY